MGLLLDLGVRAGLAEALLKCQELLDDADRSRVIGQLNFRNIVKSDDVPETHLLNLVTECSRNYLGFEQLTDALLDYSAVELEPFLEKLQEPICRPQFIAWKDVMALKRAVRRLYARELKRDTILTLFEEASPGRQESLPDEGIPAFWVFDELAKRTAVGGVHPLVTFVASLKPELDPSVHRDVERWLSTVVAVSSLGSVRTSSRDRPTSDYGAPHLLVTVRRGPGDTYNVSASLLRHQKEPLGDWICTGSFGVRSQLGGICQLVLAKLPAKKMLELVIAVFLPDDLLDWNIDQWETTISRPKHPLPLGRDLAIVLRLLSRVEDPDLVDMLPRARWIAKWNARPKPPTRLGKQHVYEARGGEELAALFRELEHERTFAFLSQVCLEPDNRPAVVETLLDTGVPLALWPRAERPPGCATDQECFEQLLYGTDFELVPRHLCSKRKETETDTSSIYWNLVLMLEDPTKVPPGCAFDLMESY
jgi:hypothetical protein